MKIQVSKAKLKQLLNTGRNKKKSLFFALKRESQRRERRGKEKRERSPDGVAQWLRINPFTKKSLVQFLVRAHAQVVGCPQ